MGRLTAVLGRPRLIVPVVERMWNGGPTGGRPSAGQEAVHVKTTSRRRWGRLYRNVGVRFPEAQHEELGRLADRRQASVSSLIREAVSRLLDEERAA